MTGQRDLGGSVTRDVSQAEIRYRRYLIATAIISLLVGLAIGALGFGDLAADGRSLTPPAAWMTPVGEDVGVVVTMPPTVTPRPVVVYVSGAVADPGVVELPSGSLVDEAIEAAGGMMTDADPNALNLAAVVGDHEHVRVPTIRPARTSVEGSPDSEELDGPVNVNAAPAERLERLPSIGAIRAAQIVAYREAHGPFTSPESLLAVPGIGPAVYADIEPWITIE